MIDAWLTLRFDQRQANSPLRFNAEKISNGDKFEQGGKIKTLFAELFYKAIVKQIAYFIKL